MDTETIFEKWRRDRATAQPSSDFADRVMQALDARPVDLVSEPIPEPRGIRRLVRAVLCTAAVLAALFRVVELLSLFAASQIEN